MLIGVGVNRKCRYISRAQCRGARGLLDLTQQELAAAAGLGLSTIVDFERARRSVSKEAIAMVRAALERGGIEFIDENGGGPGVRLKRPTKGKERK